MPKRGKERLNVDISTKEMEILNAYCDREQISKTAAVRAWIWTLEFASKKYQPGTKSIDQIMADLEELLKKMKGE